jgi:glycosyltransferase involved in cell wall biosynthesis
MADAGAELLRDFERWTAASRAARAAATERFGVDAIVGQYERYYERILAAEPVPA